MKLAEIAYHTREVRCIGCGEEVALKLWREIKGDLIATCDRCGRRQHLWIITPEKSQEDEARPTAEETIEDGRSALSSERAEKARANLRLLKHEDAPTIAPDAPADPIAAVKAAIRNAPTAHARITAERKLRKMIRETSDQAKLWAPKTGPGQ
jgi:predicted  nucleic acid-binding Zn-ribbon protein